ncbi:hypothetical protein ABPG77_010749 [Micractinium sp. CCAP 211/92]
MSGFSFSVKAKKTPFQRQKELEEERKRRDEEEAAKVYEDFVKEFGGDGPEPPRPGAGRGRGSGPLPPAAFVRGGTVRPGQPPPDAPPPITGGPAAPPGRKPGGRYIPSFMPPGMAAAMEKADGKGGEPDKGEGKGGSGSDGGGAASKSDEPVFHLPGSSSKGKPRAIDALLANLKREQEEREARKEAGLPPPREERAAGSFFDKGSFDTGDPYTTNLFVGNLAPDVDEQVLMREFGRFGPLGSVKVMWPRDEEQRRRGRNTGFVSFMKRDDAQRAMEALDGVELHDMVLSIGWGKAVPLPSVPCWPPPGGLAAQREGGAAVPPPAAAPGGADPFGRGGPPCGRFGGGRTGARKAEVVGVGPDIDVQIPEDPRQRFVIDAMAFYVMRDGCEFEQVIMEREGSNPEFNFLYDIRCPEHAYYRWRLFSLASGDTLRSWRVDMFQMVENSNRWLPPPMTVGVAPVRQKNTTAAQRGGLAGRGFEDQPLSDLQRDKFEEMLRRLTVERADVCAAMAFALDNAESAGEVVEILSDSLTLSETPIPLKIARLFLASDILHNTSSGVRNASRYRSRLEEALPDVFESLQEAYRGAEGRMAQELLRRYVLKVLRVWRGWFIFSDDYLNGLQATFLRSGGASGATHNSALEAELEALGDDELDTRCRRSGVSRKGGRSAQISRLLAVDAYLHGDSSKQPDAPADAPVKASANPTGSWATVDDDAGGQPAAGASTAPKSKWERLDEEQGQEGRQLGTAPAAAAAPPAAVTPRSKWDAAEDRQQQHAQQQQHGQQAAAPDGTPGVGSSRWTAGAAPPAGDSDSDLEDLEAQLAARRQAAPAAVPPAQAATPQAAPAAAAVPEPASTGDPVLDEERRQRLRQVELVLVQFRERLEDKGLSKAAVDAKVAEQRAKLLAEAEAAAAKAAAGAVPAAAAPLGRSGSAGGSRELDRGSRERERGRDASSGAAGPRSERKRSRSRSRERKRSRSRSRERGDRDRDRRRGSSRDRDRRRSSRSRSPWRRRSRSRSRDRRR